MKLFGKMVGRNAELKKIKLVATVEYYFADEKLNHATFEKIIQGNIFITD